jgi:hypothetical protein
LRTVMVPAGAPGTGRPSTSEETVRVTLPLAAWPALDRTPLQTPDAPFSEAPRSLQTGVFPCDFAASMAS